MDITESGHPRPITDKQIGERIIELRERRGWNQGDLSKTLKAHGLNWSQGTLSKVESGARPVRLAEAQLLATALRTKVYELLHADLPLQTESDTKQRVRAQLSWIDSATRELEQAQKHLEKVEDAQREAAYLAGSAHTYLRQVSMVFADILEANEEPEGES
jgi:transcriptional regulator with XRE-family HTH domain